MKEIRIRTARVKYAKREGFNEILLSTSNSKWKKLNENFNHEPKNKKETKQKCKAHCTHTNIQINWINSFRFIRQNIKTETYFEMWEKIVANGTAVISDATISQNWIACQHIENSFPSKQKKEKQKRGRKIYREICVGQFV